MPMTRKTSPKSMKMIRKPSRPSPPPPPQRLPLITTRKQCRLQRISCTAPSTPPSTTSTTTSPLQIIRIKREMPAQSIRNVADGRNSRRRHLGITPPIKTSCCLTMLLAALILLTDCVGSEMDALKTLPPTSLRISNVAEENQKITTLTTESLTKATSQTTITPTITTNTRGSKNVQEFQATATNQAEELTQKQHEDQKTLQNQNGSQIAITTTTTPLTNFANSLEEVSMQMLEEPPMSESESLTKGFSIPTFLPPFQLFDVDDLHAYAAGMVTKTTTTATPTTTAPTKTTISRPLTTTNNQNRPLHIKDIYENHLETHHSKPKQQQQQYKHSHQLHIALGGIYGNRKQDEHGRGQQRLTTTMPTQNLTVQMGNHAYLPCNMPAFSNKSVSWVRLRDGHILTVDETSFIMDQRIQAIYKNDDNELTWSLQIKYVRSSDAGWYECQVASEPKMSAQIYMTVVVPFTELIGDQTRFVKAGSKVALHCIVRGTLEPPSYIIWYHGKLQVMADNKWGWYTEIDRTIFGNVSSNQNTIGSLIIPFVRKADSGNYTCQPSNSEAVSVDLHVLSGEYSASAIMSGCSAWHLNASYLTMIFSVMALLKT